NTRESEEGKARHVSEGVEEIAKPVVTRGVSSTVSRSTPTTPLKLTR
uniref:Uncharacterized protein n=1 Tax=Romanomermis culicivorax TaxID=13658 RepID=A0A915IX15_ROMCU